MAPRPRNPSSVSALYGTESGCDRGRVGTRLTGWALYCVVLLLFAGCRRPAAVVPPETPAVAAVATVDGQPVTAADLEAELARVSAHGSTVNGTRVLEDYLYRQSLVARARRAGLDRDPSVRRGFENLLIARLKETELEPQFTNPPANTAPTTSGRTATADLGGSEVRLALLRLKVSSKAGSNRWDEARTRLLEARELARKLPTGTLGFGTLAMGYSDDDATRYRSGDLGWLEADPTRHRWDTNAFAAGLALAEPGDISEPIRGNDGIYLVRLIARRRRARESEPSLAAYAAQREQRQAAETEFAATTRRLIQVTIQSNEVARILARFTNRPPEPPAPR